MRRIGWSHAHLLKRAYEMGLERTSGTREFYRANAGTSKKTDDRHTPWQVNLQRLLSSNPAQAVTVSSWPKAANETIGAPVCRSTP
jgi:hypothetical protein